jgi:hypothetical protein
MNAGSVPKTCKSNGNNVAIQCFSGERVSNTWVTFPKVGHNYPKGLLISYILADLVPQAKIYRFGMGPRHIS